MKGLYMYLMLLIRRDHLISQINNNAFNVLVCTIYH